MLAGISHTNPRLGTVRSRRVPGRLTSIGQLRAPPYWITENSMVSNTGRGTASGMTIAVLILHSQWKILHTPSRLGTPIKGANPDCDGGEQVPLRACVRVFRGGA
jgi:hypothetical protein